MRRTPLEHFTLLSEFEISKEDLLAMRRHLTHARREVGRDLVFFPDREFEVLLTTRQTFEEYTAMPAHVSGYFDGRIHVPLPSQTEDEKVLKAILWHEYTHAAVDLLTAGKCPLWLHEGLAMYEEAKMRGVDLRLLADFVRKAGRLPLAIEGMDAALEGIRDRDPAEARMVYEQSYTLVNYLFSRFSRANVHAFLEAVGSGKSVTDAAAEVFHLSPDDLSERWLLHTRKLVGD
jgi:hypothetical protein